MPSILYGNVAISGLFLYSGFYLSYALIASRHIPDRPVLWELCMMISNLAFGAFGIGMFAMDQFTEGNELASMLLPWAQVSNAGAGIINAFFLYLSYNSPKSNPFSDPRYVYIFVMNEVADIAGVVWGIRTYFKSSSYCDICNPEGECYDETA